MFRWIQCLLNGHLWTFHSKNFRSRVIECERCGRKEVVL
jgi:hypothetical protein